jgi:hypothetical protein
MTDDPKEAAVRVVRAYVADSYEALAQIEIAKRRLDDIKRRVPGELAPIARGLTPDERIALFRHFYWNAIDLVSDPVLTGLGFKSIGSILTAMLPASTGVPCLGCGTDLPAHSRTEFHKIHAAAMEQDLPAYADHLRLDLYCPRCRDNAMKARSRRWDQEHAQRQREWRARQTALRAMPFADYLRTPEWQSARAEALERSGFRCQICGPGEGALDVYHNSLDRIGHEAPSDLIVLCRPCYTKNQAALPIPTTSQGTVQ